MSDEYDYERDGSRWPLALACLVGLALLAHAALGETAVEEAAFSTRPCPVLTARIDVWLGRLAEPLAPATRRALKARLGRVGPTAVARMEVALDAARTALTKAESARDEAAIRRRVAQLLDLIELLGASRDPRAYAPLAAGLVRAEWTGTLRRKTVFALGALSDPRALPALAKLAGGELAYEAGKAILAIERFEAVPHWIALLDSPVADLKFGAHAKLKTWSGESYPDQRRAWARYLAQYPEGFRRLPGYRR